MMMPKTNVRALITATAMTKPMEAWTSCRRNRAVGRRAAHRDHTRPGVDGSDPETWAMVQSDMRGRSRTPLTFAGIGEKSYNGSDLVVSCNAIGSCFSSRRSEERRVGKGCRSRWQPEHERRKNQDV